jgi:hypothetical protein
MKSTNSFSHLLADPDSELFKIVSDSLDARDIDDVVYAFVTPRIEFEFLGVGFPTVEDARDVLGIPKGNK